MKKEKIIIYLLLTFICISIFVSCSPDNDNSSGKINLKFNLPKEGSYKYIIKNTQDLTAMGSSMHQELNIEVNYKKLKDSSRNQLIKTTIDRVTLKVKSPSLNISIDTKDDATPHTNMPAAAQMIAFANHSYLIKIDTNGQISDIFSASDSKKEALDSTLYNLLQQTLDFYPKHPIAIGDSWKTTVNIPVRDINTTLKTTYTLTDVKGDTAIVKALTSISAPTKTIIMNQNKMQINVNGTQKGTLKILISEGRLFNANFTSKINSIMHAEGQELESVTDGTSVITSEKSN